LLALSPHRGTRGFQVIVAGGSGFLAAGAHQDGECGIGEFLGHGVEVGGVHRSSFRGVVGVT
jgi:hypothetical protein